MGSLSLTLGLIFLISCRVMRLGERLTTFVSVLLTAVLTSCFSSLLGTVSLSSSNNKGRKGSRRLGGGVLDSAGAVLSGGDVTTHGLNVMHSGHVEPPGIILLYLSLFHSTLTPVLLVRYISISFSMYPMPSPLCPDTIYEIPFALRYLYITCTIR